MVAGSEPSQSASLMPEALYPPSKDICYLRFWYYLHTNSLKGDETIGSLTVFIKGKIFDFVLSILLIIKIYT